MSDNSCLVPGAEHPIVVVLGPSGSGRTEVSNQLGKSLGVLAVESEELIGQDGQALLVTDVSAAHERLDRAALDLLRGGGEGAGSVVSLHPSAVLDGEVMEGLQEAQAVGTKIVCLEADLNTLVRRTGLLAPRPASLGPIRSWFRGQLAELNSRYEELADLWCDTSASSPAEVAAGIVTQLGLDSR